MDIAEYETAEPTVLAVGRETGTWAASELDAACRVRTATDAAAAVAAAEDATVDCVVAGDAGGPSAVSAVRELDADLPIVYAPSTGDPSEAAAASAAGATRYLPRSVAGEYPLAQAVDALVDDFDRVRQRRRERRMFRSLLGVASQSIYFKDEDARAVCLSDVAEHSVDERMIGKTDLEVYADEVGVDAARAAYEDDLAVIESGEPIQEKEERHVREGDEALWLQTSKFPRRNDDGAVIGLVGMTRDVTAAKERERELEREKRRLEQFASFASHDLRNPLVVANGHLQRAVETGADEPIEEAREALDRM